MNELLGYTQVYLNDILITSNGSFEEHYLSILMTVLYLNACNMQIRANSIL
jgi:hypothetical protein